MPSDEYSVGPHCGQGVAFPGLANPIAHLVQLEPSVVHSEHWDPRVGLVLHATHVDPSVEYCAKGHGTHCVPGASGIRPFWHCVHMGVSVHCMQLVIGISQFSHNPNPELKY